MGCGAMTWGDPRGLWRFHPAKSAYGGTLSPADEQAAFDESIANGVTLFDTAAMYAGGAAELRLGELGRGANILIASKFPRWVTFRTERFPDELAGSLQRLGRTAIDLYQHHFPSRGVAIQRLMELMADAVDAGTITAVGVSNYSATQMREAHSTLARRGIPLASNQVEYSLLNRKVETNGLLDACRELGVTLIAYSPMAGGALSGKYGPSAPRARGLRRFLPNFSRRGMEAAQPVIGLLRRIGGKYSKSPGQVALRWLIENPNVLPIPGAKTGAQAAENAGALSFSLTGDEVMELSAATAAWR